MSLFIGRLPYDVRERELEDMFSRYGRLQRLDIKKGYAFIEFEDGRDAEDALKEANGRRLGKFPIVVEWARDNGRKPSSDECFRCRRAGHWAKDCPDFPPRRRSRSPRRSHRSGYRSRSRSYSRSPPRRRYSSRSPSPRRGYRGGRSPSYNDRSPRPSYARDRSRSRSPVTRSPVPRRD